MEPKLPFRKTRSIGIKESLKAYEYSFGVRPRDEKKPGGREVSQLIRAISVICGSEYDRSVAHARSDPDASN